MGLTLTTSHRSLWEQSLTWAEIEKLVYSGACQRMMLIGLPGLGKTNLAVRTAKRMQKPLASITLTDATREETLIGQYTLKPMAKGGNKVIWQHGIAIKAWLEGSMLLLNELSARVSPEALHILHAILDDPEWTQLTLPTGETVRPKPGFQVIGTSNDDDLPTALQDRFPTRLYVTKPHPDAILALSEDLRELAENTAAKTKDADRIGIRQWMEFDKLRKSVDEQLAARAVFGDRATDLTAQIGIVRARGI